MGTGADVTNAVNLARQSGNLIKNPTSTDGTAGSSTPEGAGLIYMSASPATLYPGLYARKITENSSNYGEVYVSDFIPCVPGEEFLFQAQGAYGTAIRGSIFAAMQFFDLNKAYIGGSQALSSSGTSGNYSSPSTMRVTSSAPSTACFVRFLCIGSGGTVGDVNYFNNFYAERTQAGVVQINSVDYLTNADKITLIKSWNDEQQILSQLDAQATTLGVTTEKTAYDNAVAALSTNLISAGAPAGWATSWPDGTTWNATSIMINLKTWWGSIALNRATLQKALTAKVQANAAYADALARSSNNLIKNGNSTNASSTGYEAAGMFSIGVTNMSAGGWVRKLTCAGTAGSASQSLQVSDFIPCTPGDQHFMSGQCIYDNIVRGNIRMVIYYCDAAKSGIGGSSATSPTGTSGSASAPSTVSVTNTAVAGAAYVVFAIQQDTANPGDTSWFNNLYGCRKVSLGMLQGDAIQTSNYAESGGNPTAGARMDISGTAIKTMTAGLQIGSYVFTDYFWRQFQAIDGSSGNRVWYRGNVDATYSSGVPNIGTLTVTRRRWDATVHVGRLDLEYQPTAANDNLDTMRFAKILLYRQSAAGTTATLTLVDTFYQPLTDRRYFNAGTDSNTGNSGICTFQAVDTSISGNYPAAVITLYNAYGASAGNCFYSNTGNVDGSALVNNGTTWGGTSITGASGGSGSSGGGAGGGGCPAPWVKIQLASGLLVDASDLYDGASVVGVDDVTLTPKLGIVRHPTVIWTDRVPILLEDGTVTEFSAAHRLYVVGRGWVEAHSLKPGDTIMAQQPSVVRGLGQAHKAQVITFTVEGSATYFADGLLSHNSKTPIP